ncbi:unnamed protein product [Caenorhabditis auriculariae]|uniref:DUF19 domain-containing protein n=1 Tax=Caenorhabditis auriculariae TaxID=2777116 RepID=A0A8S1GSG0_9PELO|nr:unnamed protein product [Caenorhabditis auriculariae]
MQLRESRNSAQLPSMHSNILHIPRNPELTWSISRATPSSMKQITAFALVVFFFFAVPAVSAQSGLDCDSTTYVLCQQDLDSTLDYGDSQPWYNPEAFRTKVESYYQSQGVNGIRKVCKAFREFKQCMGGNYTVCMSPTHFVSLSATPLNAYQFVGLFNQMHYICGAGLQTYLANENCMSSTWKGDSGDQLNACRTAFEQKSDTNPDQACSQGNLYLTCFENKFKSGCGDKSNDAQFLGLRIRSGRGLHKIPAMQHPMCFALCWRNHRMRTFYVEIIQTIVQFLIVD